MDRMNFFRIRCETAVPAPNHNRSHEEPRTRLEVVEVAQHCGWAEPQPNLLVHLTQGRLGSGLAGINSAAGQRELTRVVLEMEGPLRQHKGSRSAVIDDRDRDSSRMPVALRRLCLEPGEVRREFTTQRISKRHVVYTHRHSVVPNSQLTGSGLIRSAPFGTYIGETDVCLPV